MEFNDVQHQVADLIKDKVIVGHSLWNDLSGRLPWHMFQEAVATGSNSRFPYSVLGIPHPAVNTRDVALYQPFRNALRSPNQLVRLSTLTFHLMGRRCQESQQNPVRSYYPWMLKGQRLTFGGLALRQLVGERARCARPLPLMR